MHFQCTLDGNETGCNTESISYTDLQSGEHTFSVRAYDTTDTYGSIHSATYTGGSRRRIRRSTLNPRIRTSSATVTSRSRIRIRRCSISARSTPTQPRPVTQEPRATQSRPRPHTFTVTAYGANDSGLTHLTRRPRRTPGRSCRSLFLLLAALMGRRRAGHASLEGRSVRRSGRTQRTRTPRHAYQRGTSGDQRSSGATFTTDNFAAGRLATTSPSATVTHSGATHRTRV